MVQEVHRVLRPGGLAVFSFSNRCFPSKVILMWGLNMEDGVGHCRIVANYFRWGCPEPLEQPPESQVPQSHQSTIGRAHRGP